MSVFNFSFLTIVLLLVVSNLKGQEVNSNLQLIYLEEDSAYKFVPFFNVKNYVFYRKNKQDSLEISFVNSKEKKNISLEKVWGMVFNRIGKIKTDTFLLKKGFSSRPFGYELLEGDINNNAIFFRKQSIFVLYGNINLDRYYLMINKNIIKITSKKDLIEKIKSPCLKEKLSSSNKSIDWFLRKDPHTKKIRLLSLVNECE